MKKKLILLSFIALHTLFLTNVKAQKITLSETAVISTQELLQLIALYKITF
jgi:hypothetical protein